MDDIEDAIDRLYQGDLGAFVAERNALAKAAKRPDLKALEKPSLSAWAVNQVFWRQRALFARVVHAAETVRAQHRLVLTGQAADVRAAETAHRAVISEAVAAARAIATEAGHPVTAATVEAITRTFEALPSTDAPGRLARPLAPAGLEALAGLSLAAASAERAPLRLVGAQASTPVVDASAAAPAAAAEKTTSRPTGPSAADRDRLRLEREMRDREAGEARKREAQEREARRQEAEAAVDLAAAAYLRAQEAVAEAEDALTARRGERDEARAAYDRAKRAARDLA